MNFSLYVNPQTKKIWCINADATLVVYGSLSGLYTRTLRVSSFDEITRKKVAAGFYRLETLTITDVVIPPIWTICALYFDGIERVIEAQEPEDYLPVFKQIRDKWDIWPTSVAMVRAVTEWLMPSLPEIMPITGKRCFF